MSARKTDDIDKFFEYGIDVNTRTLFMGSMETDMDGDESGTDASMAEYVIKGLHILDNYSKSEDKPITILMNNLGGYVTHGMAIYDAIRACQNHVTIVVLGQAMSMGGIILQAADKRVMAPNAKLMIHYGYDGFAGHGPTAYKHAENSKKYDMWMEDMLWAKIKEQKPKFTKRKLKEWLMADTFFNATEAVEYGLADTESKQWVV